MAAFSNIRRRSVAVFIFFFGAVIILLKYFGKHKKKTRGLNAREVHDGDGDGSGSGGGDHHGVFQFCLVVGHDLLFTERGYIPVYILTGCTVGEGGIAQSFFTTVITALGRGGSVP